MSGSSRRAGGWGLLVPLSLLALLTACDAPGARRDAPAADTGVLARLDRPADGGEVHLVRLVARGGEYAFEPPEIRVDAGDLVRFVQTSSLPESVAFDTSTAPPGGAAFLRQRDAVHGVLLTRPGQVYDVSFRDAPPGRYEFFSVPHAERGMRGAVVVGNRR